MSKNKDVEYFICEVCNRFFSNDGARARHMKLEHPDKYEERYKEEVKCDNCGSKILRTKSKVSKYDHHFCDKSCEREYGNRDRSGDYPRNWEAIKSRVKERDNYKCQNCGEGGFMKTLHVHHIDKDKSNCDFENLTTLCASCHAKLKMD